MALANTTRIVKDWQRKTWHNTFEVPGSTLFRVEMIHSYEGAIEGEGSVQYIIGENKNLTGSVIALEKVIGSIDGRKGRFVLQQIGTFDHGKLKLALTVVPGSGTEQLSDLRGQAMLESDLHQEVYTIPLEFSFEKMN